MSDSSVSGMPPIPIDHGPVTPPPLPVRPVGWGYRVGAFLIDLVIFGVPSYLAVWMAQDALSAMQVLIIVTAILQPALRIELLRRFGGTPGKRLLKFHVESSDGSPITYKQAFIRESVLVVLGLITEVNVYMQLAAIPPENAAGWNFLDPKVSGLTRNTIDRLHMPLSMAWLLLNFTIMVTNSQFRALHDKMAGTIVVFDNKPTN